MAETKGVLILFAHPAYQRSRVNRVLIEAAGGIDGVTVNDLYEAYPDFHIDVGREQDLLSSHQTVVFHHPFYWYSTPAILREWQDLVLEHGWAYGSEGHALEGKALMSAITTGGSEAAYTVEGSNHCSMCELLRPIERTAQLCGMTYLPPFVVHGTHDITPDQVSGHAADYARLLIGLRDGSLDLSGHPAGARINSRLDDILS